MVTELRKLDELRLGTAPHDERNRCIRDAGRFFPLPHPRSLQAWEQRRQAVRRRILLSAGLLPEPQRTPLHAKIWGLRQYDGFTVEKVLFESRPGFMVCGNLYRPAGRRKRLPVILSPHGHGKKGRLDHNDLNSVPARCITLSRLGFIVFSYDMIGYNDTLQLNHPFPDGQFRQAALHGINPFGLQLWNSIRSVDFVQQLPDADRKKIGCTGTSGGGTQTYYLGAVDERVKVLAPVCMMSATYQGGCLCEEAPLLHLDDLSSVDVVAALAPRPVLLPSVTRDWTHQNPMNEVPAVRRIYRFYGAAKRVGNVHIDAAHGYPRAIREAAYAWFLKWLAGKDPGVDRIAEPDFIVPADDELRLFPDGVIPARFPRGKACIQHLIRLQDKWTAPPANRRRLKALRKRWQNIFRETLGVQIPEQVAVRNAGRFRADETGGLGIFCRILGRPGQGDQIPAFLVTPEGINSFVPDVVLVHGEGKSRIFSASGPGPLLAPFLSARLNVLAIDTPGIGEATAFDDQGNPLYYAFNPSRMAQQVADIITAVTWVRQVRKDIPPILAGTGLGGVLALIARAVAGALAGTIADISGCAVETDEFWTQRMFHPGIRRIGDIRGAITLGPDSPLFIAGAGAQTARWVHAVFRLLEPDNLRVSNKPLRPADLGKWIFSYRR